MINDKPKDYNQKKVIEQHDTAAWANIDTQQEVSQVNIPGDLHVLHAKKHVDNNQK